MSAGPIEQLPVDQALVLRHLGLNPANPADQALVLMCQTVGLNPLLGHAVIIQGKLYVTAKGMLHVAHRSGQFDGYDLLSELTEGDEYVVRVLVHRKDMSHPVPGVGRYLKNKKGTAGWAMAKKNALMDALRVAFDVGLPSTADDGDEPTTVLEPTEPPPPLPEPKLQMAPPASPYIRPEPPPLPDPPMQRAQRLAMLTRDVGMTDDQRHRLVEHVTGGRTATGKELTDEEFGRAVALVTRIKRHDPTVLDEFGEELRSELAPLMERAAS